VRHDQVCESPADIDCNTMHCVAIAQREVTFALSAADCGLYTAMV